jgi:hypothetical protein
MIGTPQSRAKARNAAGNRNAGTSEIQEVVTELKKLNAKVQRESQFDFF